jgi:cytochrome c-type biogenesis protein CcmH
MMSSHLTSQVRLRKFIGFSFLCLALSILAVSLPGLSFAQVDTFEFETQEQQKRFRSLSDELRCPMCQNTSLSGSTGGVAEDLRREVHRMIMEGMSDEQIEQFMYERYGDFIFYKPRLKPETILLWFGPLLFFLIGAIVLVNIWRKAKKMDAEPVVVTGDSKSRLDALIAEHDRSKAVAKNSNE